MKILCAALVALASAAHAADVALVTEDNKILQQIAEGFRGSYSGTVETFSIDAKNGSDVLGKVKASNPKVVVALGSGAAKQAKESLGNTPLLFGGVLSPKTLGLEGSNIGGVPMAVPIKRQWAAAQKALGTRARRIGVLYKDDNTAVAEEAADAAGDLGVKLKASPVQGDNLNAALNALEEEVDAVWIPLDPAVAQQIAFKAIVDFALRRKVPLLVPAPSYVKQGGLMAVSMSYPEMGVMLAAQAKAIVGGATVKAATAKAAGTDEVTVNMAVAKEIGVSFPFEFLSTVKSKVE